MAMFMNEYDVTDACHRFSGGRTPNLAHAAHVLSELVDWTNSNSDGWPYWAKPRQAADRLVGTLQDAIAMDRNGTLFDDIPDADVQRALRPIKAFLTRQGVDHNAELPWAALFPVTA